MKIALFNPVKTSISGGYREYLEQFLARADQDPRVESILFLSIPSICRMFSGYKKVKTFHIGLSYNFFPNTSHVMKCLLDFSPDILYSPVEKMLPSYLSAPRIVMVQNMEPLLPQLGMNSFLLNLRHSLLSFLAKRAVRNADHVIALSRFVEAHLIDKLGLDEVKITRIPHGADIKSDLEARKPLQLNPEDKFIFTAGTISPARGLEDILSAFIKLKADEDYRELKLYIAGGVQPNSGKYYRYLQDKTASAGLADQVEWLGFVKPAEMKWCFSNCEVFVMTSRMESFGIIALEAMVYGARVVSSNSPCLPEIFGDYASYYSPGDVQAFTIKIREAIESKGKIESEDDSVESDPAQAIGSLLERFNWNNSYNSTIDLFLQLSNQPTQTDNRINNV